MSRSKREKRLKRILRWALKLCLRLIFVLLILTSIQVFILRYLNPPFTAFMAWNWIQSQVSSHSYRSPLYHWRELEKISPHMVRAVMAGEDQRFLSHHGFDFVEMKWAFRDLVLSRRVRGASTITMQVARTIFLWHERSWSRKLAEAYYTLLIEIMWSKRRIMEIYLNTVDLGAGIMGVEAASRKYFKMSSEKLSPSHSASLAAILPSPHKWSPNNPNTHVKERKQRIMNEMKKMPRL